MAIQPSFARSSGSSLRKAFAKPCAKSRLQPDAKRISNRPPEGSSSKIGPTFPPKTGPLPAKLEEICEGQWIFWKVNVIWVTRHMAMLSTFFRGSYTKRFFAWKTWYAKWITTIDPPKSRVFHTSKKKKTPTPTPTHIKQTHSSKKKRTVESGKKQRNPVKIRHISPKSERYPKK